MKSKWLHFFLVVLFGSFGALYTWRDDKWVFIWALIVGTIVWFAGAVELAVPLGGLFQVVYGLVILFRPKDFYENYYGGK